MVIKSQADGGEGNFSKKILKCFQRHFFEGKWCVFLLMHSHAFSWACALPQSLSCSCCLLVRDRNAAFDSNLCNTYFISI